MNQVYSRVHRGGSRCLPGLIFVGGFLPRFLKPPPCAPVTHFVKARGSGKGDPTVASHISVFFPSDTWVAARNPSMVPILSELHFPFFALFLDVVTTLNALSMARPQNLSPSPRRDHSFNPFSFCPAERTLHHHLLRLAVLVKLFSPPFPFPSLFTTVP